MFKNIAIVVLAIVFSAGIGLMLPFAMSDQTIGVEVDEAELNVQFRLELQKASEKAAEEQELALIAAAEDAWNANVEADPGALENFIDKANEVPVPVEEPEQVPVEVAESDKTEADKSETDVAKVEEVLEPVVVEEKVEEELTLYELESVPLGSEEKVTEALVKDAWVNQKISANRDAIADDDLYSGADIYNQLDTEYLFGLASDGLTAEEEVEAKNYLSSNLNDQELAIAMELYNKYVHLLN